MNKTKLFSETDFTELKNKVVLLDMDGTIVADHSKNINIAEKTKVESLSKDNDIFLCSNGSIDNVIELSSRLNIKYLKLKKPLVFDIRKRFLNRDIVVIGDKFITDGIFALLNSADFIKVLHLRSINDSDFIKFSYKLDRFVYKTFLLLKTVRPWQWIKNLLVFAPAFFAGIITDFSILKYGLITFVSFSLASSAAYIINDIADRENDSLNKNKKNRPIASGEVSVDEAKYLLLGISLLLLVSLYIHPPITLVIFFYLILNGVYSSFLKHIAVVDIVLVSIFYILRILAGSISSNAPLSSWIILCLFFGSLFVIVGKRRAEYDNYFKRKVLHEYSKEALNFMLVSSASLSIISYGLYSVIGHEDIPLMVYSTFFVVVAIFRILNKIYTHREQAEAPEYMVFKDKVVFGSFVAWLAYLFLMFYNF